MLERARRGVCLSEQARCVLRRAGQQQQDTHTLGGGQVVGEAAVAGQQQDARERAVVPVEATSHGGPVPLEGAVLKDGAVQAHHTGENSPSTPLKGPEGGQGKGRRKGSGGVEWGALH